MPINILMPALSPTMEKGNLAKWLKKEGDAVKSGDVIAEIETDKATMEVEAVDDGTLAKILVPEGTQDVAVNDIIAVLAGEGEDVKAAGAAAKSAPKSCFETRPAGAPQDEAATSGKASTQPRSETSSLARGGRHGRLEGRRPTAPTAASSRRRWRGGWRRMPGSNSAASMAPVRMAGSLRATWRARSPARG